MACSIPGGAFSLASALFWAVRSRGAEDVCAGSETRCVAGFDGFPLDRGRRPGRRRHRRFSTTGCSIPTRDAYWQAIDGERPRRCASGTGPVDGRLVRSVSSRPARRLRSASGATRARTWPLPRGWSSDRGAMRKRSSLPGDVRESELPSRKPRAEHPLVRSSPAVERCRRQPDAPVRLYVMGANVWRDEQEWPLARARDDGRGICAAVAARTRRR